MFLCRIDRMNETLGTFVFRDIKYVLFPFCLLQQKPYVKLYNCAFVLFDVLLSSSSTKKIFKDSCGIICGVSLSVDLTVES